MSIADTLNAELARHHPAAAQCLSALGRRAFFPPGIPAQSADARGTRYNATIGQVTDGHGSPLPLPALAAVLSDLDPRMSHLYSPPAGHAALRDAWAARQRRHSGGSTTPTSRPFLTLGLTQALGFAAELFVDEGTPVIVPGPRWGNYDQVFSVRRGGALIPAPLFDGRRATLEPLADTLAGTAGPAMLVLNFPHNPTGVTPSAAECASLVDRILDHDGPLTVLVDDAYANMLWEDGLPERSLFWDLAERHDPSRHLILRADGVTKELLFFPGRVGFMTAAVDPESPAAAALESKLAGLARSAIGSPPGPNQAAVLHALSQPDLEDQIDAAYAMLERRYHRLKAALADAECEQLQPYPFNSGVFALVGLADGVDAENVRRELIEEQSVGLVRIGGLNALRIAFCSVDEDDIEELVERVARHLAG